MEVHKPELVEVNLDNVKTESNENKECIKKFPEKYHEIYRCYKEKDYAKCLSIIEDVTEDHIEYKILESACLIHLGTKVSEAHKILDEVLERDPENAFTIYGECSSGTWSVSHFKNPFAILAKGLAYYHEKKYQESAECFEKAFFLDQSPDMERAEIMMEKAQVKFNEMKRTTKPSEPFVNFKRSPQSSNIIRRFGCDLCSHFFGKKFNLDRHNRTIHKRSTPANFPTNQKYPSGSPKLSPVSKVKVEETQVKQQQRSDQQVNIPQFVRKGKIKCNICKKMFKKSSIARHVIIHTGNKSHRCSECSMAFFQKSDLTRHEVIID